MSCSPLRLFFHRALSTRGYLREENVHAILFNQDDKLYVEHTREAWANAVRLFLSGEVCEWLRLSGISIREAVLEKHFAEVKHLQLTKTSWIARLLRDV